MRPSPSARRGGSSECAANLQRISSGAHPPRRRQPSSSGTPTAARCDTASAFVPSYAFRPAWPARPARPAQHCTASLASVTGVTGGRRGAPPLPGKRYTRTRSDANPRVRHGMHKRQLHPTQLTWVLCAVPCWPRRRQSVPYQWLHSCSRRLRSPMLYVCTVPYRASFRSPPMGLESRLVSSRLCRPWGRPLCSDCRARMPWPCHRAAQTRCADARGSNAQDHHPPPTNLALQANLRAAVVSTLQCLAM